MSKYLLELIDVVKSVGVDKVLDRINLFVPRGEFIVIRGRSGVGKTTLAKIMALITRPDSGKVLFQGVDVTNKHADHIRLKYIGYIDQFFRLLPRLNVFENIELPLKLLGIPKKLRTRMVMNILKTLGLEDKAYRFPRELSGGERQRIAIARAIVKNPLLIVADEPLSNLDDETASIVLKLFKDLVGRGSAVVLTTTDLYIDFDADRDFILANGRLVER